MTELNSTYTVSDYVNVPEALASEITFALADKFIEPALFRSGGTATGGVIQYRERAARSLADAPEIVAEYAEIPVSNAVAGDFKHVDIYKTALGIQISREMIRDNNLQSVEYQKACLVADMEALSVDRALTALNNPNINTVAASTPWDTSGADPILDLLEAQEAITTAVDADGSRFNFSADTLFINTVDYNRLFVNERVQKFFIGNIANENPLYKGELSTSINGLKVVASASLEPGTAYVLQAGTAGFYADADPLTVTPLYSANGDNNYGGSNQTYRLDAFISRGVALDAPKAVTKIEGIRS